jgi:hypothetical protein
LEKRRDELKREGEQRHRIEMENIKAKYVSKLQIEKERI